MYVEKRKVKGGVKYYLAHSFRHFGSVRKTVVYLGKNLSESEVARRRKTAERKVKKKIERYVRSGDPFYTEIDFDDKVLRGLKVPFSIFHLSDPEWIEFMGLFTYDTNAIEGSELGKKDVVRILKGEQVEGRETDVEEAIGLRNAIGYIRKKKPTLSVANIKQLHKMVFKNTLPFAGEFRKVNVIIRDLDGNVIHRGFDWEKIDRSLKQVTYWYHHNQNRYQPIVLAAVVHNRFEEVHPFRDGNGRVGRLLTNLVLLHHGYPPVNITLDNRGEYYGALRDYTEKRDTKPMIKLILKEYKKLKRQLKR